MITGITNPHHVLTNSSKIIEEIVQLDMPVLCQISWHSIADHKDSEIVVFSTICERAASQAVNKSVSEALLQV